MTQGRVLGIDPGLNITGYAVLDGVSSMTLVEAGVIRSKARDSLESRVRQIHEGVAEVIRSLSPTSVAVEELFSHYDRPKTAILMGHARGVICLAAASAGLTVSSYAATHVKKMLTGSGRAPKSQMQLAVCREFQLAEPPEPADVADAMAIALCHCFSIRPLGGMEQLSAPPKPKGEAANTTSAGKPSNGRPKSTSSKSRKQAS